VLVLHASDLQVGRPYRPDRSDALLRIARELDPDVVVIAGDLTQRAKRREYETVRTLLDRLAPWPTVVTPGNHDVPLYRFWERLLVPYRNWRRYVSGSLDSVLTLPGAVAVALNSSAPRRAIVGGRLSPGQVDLAREKFAHASPEAVRLLVVHHHFVAAPDGEGGRPLPHARSLLQAFEAMGVDAILGGHVHQAHVTTSRDVVAGDGPGIPLVACGTTTSSRGRGVEEGENSLNVVEIRARDVEVTPHRFIPEVGRFEPFGPPVRLPRSRLPSTESAGR
jgi:3',5'-cyclic AMP phosphodiesterase CpdA